MKKIKLFIAMSLDGYIADDDGGVNWLMGQGKEDENVDSYAEFIKEIDTIIMGWNTYHQILTELSPDVWPYDDCITYVVTHKRQEPSKRIQFVNEDLSDLVNRLKKEKGKDIWICGGANLVQQLIDQDLIDLYYITVIPTILGSGIRLFENGKKEIKLRLVKTQTYNGMVDLVYTKR